MTTDRDAVRHFFRTYAAGPVGPTPPQPLVEDDEPPSPDAVQRTTECDEAGWKPITVLEAPARPGEYPERFIDGSHSGQPVVCVKSPDGWPVPLVLSEVGAVALRSIGRGFEREFVAVERTLAFVADAFPWAEVEAFAADLLNRPELRLRVLPANRPKEPHNPFDYEVLRKSAYNRGQQEMQTLERLALAQAPDRPSLVDGPLGRVMGNPRPTDGLRVGVVKTHGHNFLHEQGWRTLLSLGFSQRTPVFRITGTGSDAAERTPVASWYLKLTNRTRLAPNWGYVRVEVPWSQFIARVDLDRREFGFVNRLSRWLIDARCRADSYARMPVSLDPIVRAEDALKPLFTPAQVLVNRLYRTAGLFRGGEL